MTSQVDAVSDLKTLCACWQSAHDPATFAEIVKTCLAGNVVSPAQFRDSLLIAPTAPKMWASGAVPPRLMQEEVVEFISCRVAELAI